MGRPALFRLLPLGLSLSLVLAAAGCLFFDDTVYCDTADDCPDGASCDARTGACKAGQPPDDAGRSDAGHDDDAGPSDAGHDDDAGPSDAGHDDDAGSDAGPTVPTAPGLALIPEEPRTLDDLRVAIVEESQASAPVTYRFAWYRDEVEQPAFTTDTVPASATAKGQTWRVVVTPVADDVEGSTAALETTIRNTPPSLRGVAIYPLQPTVGDTLEAVPVGFYDPDEGDPQQVELRWFDLGVSETGAVQESVETTFEAMDLLVTEGVARVRVLAIPRDSTLAGANGEPVASCDRTVTAGPAWRSEHPLEVPADLMPGSHALYYDEAHDRLLFGLLYGRDLYGAYELSLAQPARGWSHVPFDSDEPALFASEVYVPSRGALLRFGGFDEGFSGATTDASWLDLAHGCEALTPTTLPSGPSGRMGHSSVFDPVTERVVVLLGATYELDYVGSDEVWALAVGDGEDLAWSQLTPSGTPPSGRAAASTVYDVIDHQVVVYGGLDATDISGFTPLGSVHALSLDEGQETWRTLSASGSGPGARLFAGVGLYEEGHELIVIGGCHDLDTCTDDWEADAFRLSLDQGTEAWAPLELDGAALRGPVLDMVALPDRGTFYLLAVDTADPGAEAFQLLELVPHDGAWVLHERWSSLANVPPARSRFALTAPTAPHDDLLAVYGGRHTGDALDERAVDDVWRFSLADERWTLMNQGGDAPGARHGFAWAAGQHSTERGNETGLPLVLSGGRCQTGPSTFALCGGTYLLTRFDEDTVHWTAYEGSDPTPTWASAGFLAKDGLAGGRVLRRLGGIGQNALPTSAGWSFEEGLTSPYFVNGTWSADTVAAPPVSSPAVAVSPNNNEDLVYLFGGRERDDTMNDTLYVASAVAGGDFEAVVPTTPGVAPSPREGATLTHIGPGHFVLFGGLGDDNAFHNDLWLLSCYDVATPVECDWHPYPTPSVAPGGRAFHGAAYDVERDTLWVFGGEGAYGEPARETWSFSPLRLLYDLP